MATPGFTAESSLGKTKDAFALATTFAAGNAAIVPQGYFCRSDEGGTTCTFCWDEGGLSGCITRRIPRFTAF